MLKIGNAQGFWGDRPTAPAQLIEQQPDLDYLTLEYLAEVSLSIMAIQREKNPSLGYARDLLDVIRSLIPYWKQGAKFKLITNGGGLHPHACANAVQKILQEAGIDKKIGIVIGDNILDQVKDAPHELVTANAYLGAAPIVELLQQEVEIVITGRIADPSLVVAPCIAHYGWSMSDWDRLAQATIAGHLVECGAQVTGGIATHWLDVLDPANIGYPVIEMHEDSSFVITKPPNTGGEVTERTVKEQLLYEIGDPDNMLTPDVTVSFLGIELKADGPDRMRITGAKGKAPTDSYKASCTYRDGYRCEGMLAIFGQDAVKKAYRAGEVILQRVWQSGYQLERSHIEVLGNNATVLGTTGRPEGLTECVLRIAVADTRREALECFAKEIAPLVTSGPQGTTGYITGRPKIRPVFGYWSTLMDKDKIKPESEVL